MGCVAVHQISDYKMHILILGASGFIGSRVSKLLNDLGHDVITPSSQQINLSHPISLSENVSLLDYLKQAEVIINTVGIMSKDSTLMENIHHHGPLAIAKLAKIVSNKHHIPPQEKSKQVHWINLSALGSCSTHSVDFLASKGRGDEALLALSDNNFQVNIVRPSLVFGLKDDNQGFKGGASSQLFLTLAKFSKLHIPLPLPESGNFIVQPVHVNDVAEGLLMLAVSEPKTRPNIINMTGSIPCSLAAYLQTLAMNYYDSKLIVVPLPMYLAKMGTKSIHFFSDIISIDNLKMLEEGSTADCEDFAALIGHQPQSYQTF